MRILVVFKQSNLEIYSKSARLERSPKAHAELRGGHDAHERTLQAVRDALIAHETTWCAAIA